MKFTKRMNGHEMATLRIEVNVTKDEVEKFMRWMEQFNGETNIRSAMTHMLYSAMHERIAELESMESSRTDEE